MTAGDAAPSRDAGLSAQRTRLAWRRTVMSAAAVTLLAARPAVRSDAGPVQVLAAAAVTACWVAMVALATWRGRGLAAQPPLPGRRTMPAYALITVGFAAIGVLLALG